MKIISYNVNGIRAALRKDFLAWLQAASPDVLCLQEIKATPDQFEPCVFEELGYHHNYWYPAQKKGYSGVAVLCKQEPNNVVYAPVSSIWITKAATYASISTAFLL